jgi:hypothetical protein
VKRTVTTWLTFSPIPASSSANGQEASGAAR